jgi:hypothetical protein
MAEKIAGEAHEKLKAFAGKWNTTGQVYATDKEPAVNIIATDTYELFEGGFFLVHRWDAQMGEKSQKGIEIISYDAEHDNYPMQSYNDEGTTGIMYATVNNDGTWTFKGETERCTLTFSNGGNTINGKWELNEDGAKWREWMEVELNKQAS